MGAIILNEEKVPPCIWEIEIYRHHKLVKSTWKKSFHLWSGELKPELLESQIEIKNNRLLETEYCPKRFDEAWLLLLVEGGEWSEFSSYKPTSFKPKKHWKFNRIYVFGLLENEIEEIL